MKVSRQISINTSADKVWQILGTNFNDVDQWATRMLSAEGKDDLGSQGGRVVNTIEYGEATETLYQFDDKKRELAYNVQAAGMPPMISDVTTAWRVEPQGNDQSLVEITFAGTLSDESMSDMLQQRLGEGLDMLLPDLKHYAEHDQPSPNKLAQLAAK
ncbi:MAG: SRPBCC family protein [Chloroflexota bacterium]